MKLAEHELRPSPALIFLDIDDVLCINDRYGGYDALDVVAGRHPNPEAACKGLFTEESRTVLEAITVALNGNVRFVISSTWRLHFSASQLRGLFAQSGLVVIADRMHDELRWRTKSLDLVNDRHDEITQWLADFGHGEPFAILDDASSGSSLIPALSDASHRFAGRVHLCNVDVGLKSDAIAFILRALKTPDTKRPASTSARGVTSRPAT